MPNEVNILDALGADRESTLERVRLNESEIALILFTPKGEETAIHFCDEPEIGNSVICLGSDCLLCRIGYDLHFGECGSLLYREGPR